MNILIVTYNTIIYHPLLNLLVFLYHYIPDVGVVIVLVTILVRLLLAPSFHKSLKSQQAMNVLQPKLNEIREKHKGDKEAQARATMELYKEHKINPLSSCLPLLIQLPILIALYQVFRNGLGNKLTGLYSFVLKPDHINPYFLHFLDLSKPSIVLGIVAGLAQFWQSKLMMPKGTQGQDSAQKIMSVQTTYVLPIISAVVAIRLPAGLPLYWVVTTLFAVAQQYYIMKKHPELVKK
jgi:YidC/Oxa1 family membrane protein insertase